MSFSETVQGEGKLFGALGANVTLGGFHAVAENAHVRLASLMPIINDILVLVQVAVGAATLVYMLLKIRKILKNKKDA